MWTRTKPNRIIPVTAMTVFFPMGESQKSKALWIGLLIAVAVIANLRLARLRSADSQLFREAGRGEGPQARGANSLLMSPKFQYIRVASLSSGRPAPLSLP